MYIYSHNIHSEGAKALAEALKIRRIKTENSRFVGRGNKIVINWGSSNCPPEVMKCQVINPPDRVALVTNKLQFFRTVGDRASIPDWTESSRQALDWVQEGYTVCARTILNGSGAQGLILMDKNPSTHVSAKLYTKYVPKQDEYRVHVFRGRVIDIQKKALRNGWVEEKGEVNWKIRNLENGFIYMRNDINPPDCVSRVAIDTVNAVGLDFGGVDVIYNAKRDQAFALEINSAPGLVGSTIESYARALRVLG